MSHKFMSIIATMAIILLVGGCAVTERRGLGSFKSEAPCYDRGNEPYTFVVDAHMHARPFGGPAVPFPELTEYFEKTGVRFASLFGIGQVLPVDSTCTYYLNCPGTSVTPSIRNDFVNAANYVDYNPQRVHILLSMTFMDLSQPDDIIELIELYDKEYPNIFKWVGELNVVKQAIFANGHRPVTIKEIGGWEDFMAVLKERDLPVTFHSDLGNDEEPTKYLHLMETIIQKYPDNKMVWAHMGLSKELSTLEATDHIAIMTSFLDKNPNLMLDTSWRVLEDNYFSKPAYKDLFIAFFNEYSDRILPGTDFVASRDKTDTVYADELAINSNIFQYVDDRAFRNIILGENYFRLLGLNYQAPQICPAKSR